MGSFFISPVLIHRNASCTLTARPYLCSDPRITSGQVWCFSKVYQFEELESIQQSFRIGYAGQ